MNMMCENNNADVAAIVTTYNPRIEDFRENLNSYLPQVGLVIVCDNSDNAVVQSALTLFVKGLTGVVLLPMEGNKGIAEAQNKGIMHAVEHGFEYFLEVDQDSFLPVNYVSKIKAAHVNLEARGASVAGVGSLASRVDGFIYDGHKLGDGVICVDKTLSSGFLFSKDAFQRVGVKDESLFIDYVDWEWCWRAKSHGLSTFIDGTISIEHALGEGSKRVVFFNVGIPSPIRHYYQYRNSIYLMGRRYVPFSWRVKRFFINIIKIPIYAFMFKDGGERKKYIFLGLLGAFKGQVGKIQL